MVKLFKYIKPYWLFALLAPLMMAAEVITELKLPDLMSDIVDQGILNSQPDVIISSGILMIVLVIAGGIGGFLSLAFATVAAQGFANDLRQDAFRSVVNLSFAQTDEFTVGSLVTRITGDIENVRILVTQSMRMMVRTGLFFMGGIIMMLKIDSSFALLLVIILPIEMLLILLFLKKASPMFTKIQISVDEMNAVVQENVTGSRVVKAYVKEEYEQERFEVKNEQLAKNNLRVQKIMAIVGPAMSFFLNLTTILVIYIGGIKANQDPPTIKVGSIMASLQYITMILMSVMMLAMLFQSITRARASGQRILEVLKAKPSVKSGEVDATDLDGDIIFNNVSFTYPLSTEAVLSEINLTIKKGETLAILGATGSGKTSLVNLISRFYDVTAGAIIIDEHDIKEYDLKSLRLSMGVIPQKTELFTGSILDNLQWGKDDASFEEVIEAAKIAQAHDFIMSFTNGYDTIIGEKGSSLSGGQKQRIAIARAILRKPAYLILDDSTSALDLLTEAKLYQGLSTYLNNTTIILIAQRVASAKRANRIAILDDGRLNACDTHDVLIQNNHIYQDIYYSQLKNGGELDE